MPHTIELLIGTEIAIALLGEEAATADESRQRKLLVIVRGLKQCRKWLAEEVGDPVNGETRQIAFLRACAGP